MIETSELLGCLTIVSIGVFVLLPVIELFVVIIKTATYITTDVSNYSAFKNFGSTTSIWSFFG